jgi:hypothetical protein
MCERMRTRDRIMMGLVRGDNVPIGKLAIGNLTGRR